MNLKQRAKQLKTDIPAIFIAFRKKETPLLAKILAGMVIVYALSPIDLIPDFIPLLGFLDDIILLPLLIMLIVRIIPKDIFAKCRIEAHNRLETGRQKRWYFALPMIVVWLLIIFLIVKSIWL